ncbi:GntR family transcriptional regulator [Mycobacterium sp. 21AC1]|uniref:GntR family transcriptional regulator n=1 Tax=[Mycobacterium] appelbergii TaxID=2939269 RepID=UPI0029390E60|nr:GntR family transcriptional regulator [Mycobacterium sp. 21AC1]MDV3127347.1 GntR family transcriptional regulator [Mycobacterium sp. 21AC1]
MDIIRYAAPLRDQVVAAIRESIVSGQHAPGARLKEKDLCEQVGVSRTVVREALRQLETERLVRIEPNVGPVVAELSRQDVADLYQTREALESAAARLAALHAPPEDVKTLRAVYDEIVIADCEDLQSLLDTKNRFYQALITASGNRVIGEMLHNVQARISQLRLLTLGSPGRHEHTVQELASVVEAIARKDPESAVAATVVHVRNAASIALARMDANDEPVH